MPELTKMQQDWLNQYNQDIGRIQDDLNRAENARGEFKYKNGPQSDEQTKNIQAVIDKYMASAKQRMDQLRNNPEYQQLQGLGVINVDQKISSFSGLSAEDQAAADQAATKAAQGGGTNNQAPGQSGVQIYRDSTNNFFSVDASGNKTPITLDQFKQMGLNASFVQPGQTVSLEQATTGKTSGGTDGGTGGGIGSGGTGSQVLDSQIPGDVAFRNSEAYQGLTQEEKDLVDLSFNLVTVGNEQDAKLFADALKAAKDKADPYFKAQITLATGEIGAKIADLNNDYDTKKSIIERTRKELGEDIDLASDSLTLQEKSDLAQVAKGLDHDLLTIGDQAAEKGRTFGSGYMSRDYAEQLRKEEADNVVQSTERDTNQKLAQLKIKAQRGDLDAQQQLKTLEQGKTSSLGEIGRSAEQLLGSTGVTNVPGLTPSYTPSGGVTGTIEEDKANAIIKDTNSFKELGSAFV
jgi:hypothetical protein